MKQKSINEQNWPYATLEKFGLTREMIEDLPMAALVDIASGHPSPVLPISVIDENGEVLNSRSRFAFVELSEDSVEAVFYPVLREAKLDNYTQEERKELNKGKAILTDIVLPDGKIGKGYVQIDMETNQLMSVPQSVIKNNLELCVKSYGFPSDKVEEAIDGHLASDGGDNWKSTLGVDLNEKCGIRLCDGDEQAWLKERKREWNKFTFGCYGCWVMDDNGNLDYVREEDYTEELWDEQRKAGQRNMVSMHK